MTVKQIENEELSPMHNYRKYFRILWINVQVLNGSIGSIYV